ncbi:MAG: FG-GAP-like repeat-containing protein [Candidatus Glassbacteria bacterium]
MTLARFAVFFLCSLHIALLAAAASENAPKSPYTHAVKIVVIKGRVILPASNVFDEMREGPYLVFDRYMRKRGRVEKPVAENLRDLGRRLGTGVYFLLRADRISKTSLQEEEEILTDVGDIDSDGDIDIITIRYYLPARILINQNGSFTEENDRLPELTGDPRDVDLVDVNGDSALDVFVTYSDEQNLLFINDGTGFFGDSTITHLPVDSSSSQAADWGDVDNDNDNDILVVNFGDFYSPPSEENQLLINDGSGHFTDETHERFLFQISKDLSTDALVFDAEGDLDMDLVIINDNFNYDNSRILINDGTGHFTDETQGNFPDVNGSSIRVRAEDVDGDEKPDLYIANSFWELNFLWINDGNGRFFDDTQFRTPTSSSVDSAFTLGCDIADIEGDGDSDIVVANRADWDSAYIGRGRNRLLVNDGFGFFTDRTFQIFPQAEDTTVDVDFIDADESEYIDLYITNWGEPSVLMIDPGENVGIAGDGLQPAPSPSRAFLHQNFPNPFNPQTTIRFSVPGEEGGRVAVSMAVYDIKGRLVRRLIDGELPAGTHSVVWDGRDERGIKVASGVYLARLTINGEASRIKMSLLK